MSRARLSLIGAGLAGAAGLTLGQPPTDPDVQAYKTRGLQFDLAFEPADRAKVKQVELHVSEDRGQVWDVASTVKSDATALPFAAKKDGVYWVKVVTVFSDGKTDPPDVVSAPPFQKLLIDATPPVLRFTAGYMGTGEASVSWGIEDRFPNDAKTKVEVRPVGGSDLDWKQVPVTGADRRSTRFPTTAAAVQVRVTVEDLAGNSHTLVKDVGTTAAAAPTLNPIPELTPAGGPKPQDNLVMPTIAPPVLGDPPAAPIAPPGPPAPVKDIPPPAATSPPPAPIATGTGVNTAPPAVLPQTEPPAPVAESRPTQVINYTRFDLPVQLDAGPSGVSRIDVYVTRDDGRTWVRWSEHDGKESPLKVNLESRPNPQKEGVYGFRLVAVSGAGLSDPPPASGTPPEFRLEVDETPPLVQIFTPESDPVQKDVLVLKWAVRDKNASKEPVGLEWSESAAGPWKPVAGGDAPGAVLAAGGVPAAQNRVPNTGSYAWRVPSGLPAHRVFLKVTATDAAGNKSEVVTPPVLIDLVKPRAKIYGGVQPTGGGK